MLGFVLTSAAMSEIQHPELLSDIAAFCAKNDVSKAEVGKRALGDPRFVYDLEKGRGCLPRTVRKVRDWMASYKADAA